MFNPFKRRKPADHRDVEQIITDIAENGQTKDYAALYPILNGQLVFVPTEPRSLPPNASPGYTLVSDETIDIHVRLIEGPDNKIYFPAATLETAEILNGGYVCMSWISFCEMVVDLPKTGGALLQGKTSWIAFDQKRVAHMIKKAKRN